MLSSLWQAMMKLGGKENRKRFNIRDSNADNSKNQNDDEAKMAAKAARMLALIQLSLTTSGE